MRTPVIILNFKSYAESSGERGHYLALRCNQVFVETGKSIAIAPQLIDLSRTVTTVDIPVFAQHVDPIKLGSFTGRVSPWSVKEAGAIGTLLNHSERQLTAKQIETTVHMCRDIGLETVVCANDIEMARTVAAYEPDYIAVEPPELIGGDISVTNAKPEVVRGAVDAVREVNNKVVVLCGAGVKNGKDVRKAIELGTQGVLLASGVVKAKDPRKALLDLAGGL